MILYRPVIEIVAWRDDDEIQPIIRKYKATFLTFTKTYSSSIREFSHRSILHMVVADNVDKEMCFVTDIRYHPMEFYPLRELWNSIKGLFL